MEYEHEPYTQKDVLEYGGKYYVVGSARQPLQRDKTRTEDYYLLTLAAIAKELDSGAWSGQRRFCWLPACPLTSFGRDKKKFRDYLLRDGKPVYFRYEGRDYTVRFTDVMLFPQGRRRADPDGAAGRALRHRGRHWRLDSGLDAVGQPHPQRRYLPKPELGMIRCLDEIGEKARQMFGVSMTDVQIESILRGGAVSVDDRIRAVIHTQAGQYVQDLLRPSWRAAWMCAPCLPSSWEAGRRS